MHLRLSKNIANLIGCLPCREKKNVEIKFRLFGVIKDEETKCCSLCQGEEYLHCVKRDRIRSFSGPYFPAFGPAKL